jgi:electron transfer flavoprotein beta subunit
MKIVVLVKPAPDTYGDRKLDLHTGLADRGASETVLDEINERALEVALAYSDANPGTEVVVISMAPPEAEETIRRALVMGAGSAIHIADDDLRGADLTLTAEALAATIRRTGFDLVIAGNISTDGYAGVIPGMVAELLDVPSATNLTSVEIGDGTVTGERASDGATMRLSAPLPAVISITEQLPPARIPSFKGIMAAKKKPFKTLTLADIGIEAQDPQASRSIMLAVTQKPPRDAGIKIIDEGDAGEKLAEFLIQTRLA